MESNREGCSTWPQSAPTAPTVHSGRSAPHLGAYGSRHPSLCCGRRPGRSPCAQRSTQLAAQLRSSCLLANSPPRVQRYHVLDVVLLICALRVDFLANVSDLHRFAHSVDALGGRANVTIMRLIVRLGRDERPWPLITPDGCSNEGGTRHQNRLQHGELQT